MATTSSLVSCIGSAIDNAELLVGLEVLGADQNLGLLLFRLRNLKTFILLADNSEDDPNFGSFLLTIENVVCEIAQIFHTLRLRLSGEATSSPEQLNIANVFDLASVLEEHLRDGKEEIDEFYVTLLDKERQSSNSLPLYEIGVIFNSVLDNLWGSRVRIWDFKLKS
ncbi:OLC1v1008897C1 [Oldenlandia corymbosa var. corymbosa]|uniref:OLC1v1008897C1 n=1 Tax=Oldenlandia corymbosa var. corymbosa TaxID=529605 RepID=A0AAV1DQ41_OLDCO|nr:OLC1v1008897C1 [Oldenlandia corymbosa var. corymbosa]